MHTLLQVVPHDVAHVLPHTSEHDEQVLEHPKHDPAQVWVHIPSHPIQVCAMNIPPY